MIKSHEIKNVTDFNVADSVRRDIKVLVTKTRYTVCAYSIEGIALFQVGISIRIREHQSIKIIDTSMS